MDHHSYSLVPADEEDALSLSDLPLYSDIDDQWEQDLWGSSSVSSYQDEFFEFFSQELNPPAAAGDGFLPENILFCGKIIPHKPLFEQDHSKQTCIEQQYLPRLLHNRSQKTCLATNRWEKGSDSPASKVPVLAPSSSGKARWYLFLFGKSRFSNEVKLRDIKSRQSRRQCASPPHSGGGKGLWWLITALSCGSHHHATAMVAASISRIPPK